MAQELRSKKVEAKSPGRSSMTTSLAADVRQALRVVRTRPGVAAVAAGTLALGIAANAVVFAIADAVLWHGLPFRDPGELVMVWQQDLPHDRDRITIAPGEFVHYREVAGSFASMGAASPATYNMISGATVATLEAAQISPSLLPTLGVQPVLGRVFTENEAVSAGGRVALISHGLWQREFGGSPNVLGREIRLEEGAPSGGAPAPAPSTEPYRILGVLPRDFRLFYTGTDVLTPLPLEALRAPFETRGLRVIARLNSGISIRRAGEEMSRIDAELARVHPGPNRGVSVALIPLRDEDVGDIQPTILILLAGVAMILLMTCANVANMLLARAAEREREMAVRVALGASPARLIRQLLIETLVLGGLGGVAGLALSAMGLPWLLRSAPESIPRIEHVSLGPRPVTATLLVALAAGVIAGIAPALRASRGAMAEALSLRGGDAGRRASRLRPALVTSEVALACVVLLGTSLLAKSFRLLSGAPLGFEPDHALTCRIAPPRSRYPAPADREALFKRILERVRALPGVDAAGGTNLLPLIDRDSSSSFEIEGRPAARSEELPQTRLRSASSGYLGGLGIRLVSGRDFGPDETGRGGAIVSRLLAQRYWPGRSPLGERVRLLQPGQDLPWVEIVGVADDVRQFVDTPPQPTLYYANLRAPVLMLAVRGAGDLAGLAASVRAAVREVDAELPVYDVRTMRKRVATAGQLTQGRFRASLGEGFGTVSLLLAALGVFGVMHYTVQQRTREIGIRMALGARPADILRLMLRQGLGIAGAGILLGTGGAWALTPVLARLLYGIQRTEPATWAAVAMGLAGAVLAGAVLPARRAARLDPVAALARD
jgi:putative ABC transport system permease protein